MRTRLVGQKKKKKGKESKEKITGHRQCKEECLKTRPLSGLYDWLKKGLQFFLPPLFPTFQCTPSYSSTIVHIARSLLTTRPPPSPACSARRILCMHAAAHSTHRLKTVFTTWSTVLSGLWKGARAAASKHRLHTVITLAMVFFLFFMVKVFMGETPRHLAHIWSCLMRSSVSLTLYFEPTINPLHSRVVKRLQPSSPLWQKPSDVDTWMITVCKNLRGDHLKTEQN